MRYQEIADKKKEMLAAGVAPQQVMETIMHAMVQYRKNQSERLNALMNVQLLGCDAERQALRLGFQVEEWQLNPAGTLHGGMFATAVDIAMGMLAHYYGEGNFCTTVSMTVNYLRPVKKGDMLILESCLEKAGRTLISLSAKGWGASDGKTAVTGSATYMMLEGKLK